jgi:hypothetical protein
VRLVVLLAAVSLLVRLDVGGLFRDFLAGAGIGAIVGRILIARLERRGGELVPPRVRHIELTWTCGSAFLGFLVHLIF